MTSTAATSGIPSPKPHGQTHPTIAAAIALQAHTLEQVIFAGFTHQPAAKLAHELMSAGKGCGFFDTYGSLLFEVGLLPFPETWDGDTAVAAKEQAALAQLDA